ncbi:DUF599 domain-containing protein [Thalassotalea piscium]|uniref:Putative membrane protein n=1 Tax=Thalassotalea piscium TaxID=1230533 RepID=A0A7X0NFJ5_9GAMM|nr:DUF599 domain-containing protein [Thalassotalea piscium]MBB6542465.1 putative membrane protein [Thalassotalea piscium]
MNNYYFDLFALIVFVFSWTGYTWFAKKRAKTDDCIARCLHQHRIHWMYETMERDLRMVEAGLLANLERNIAFFASTTLLVLAGVLTLFSQVDRLEQVLATIPFTAYPDHGIIQVKLGVLVVIFVMAFFHFTWSMRQYGFLNVMIGAAPYSQNGPEESHQKYAYQMAIVQDQAAHSYNYGLRAFYFSIAVVLWFFHPFLLIFVSLFVVHTLFNREFRSKAVKAITEGQKILESERNGRKNNI